eukprot:CAMPEP_0179051618 /NCGR_PEP_ID=MMETSP0796-20121207/21337_1 /TAXON_ID=73915 /ORGANISM="Pyrodinium bahamense, Strain pbaha01" /LENGTH=208 /DNA_ID=CAMNT_0020748163 /DNA_START=636 /DNA_END=1261 /DNA_ORIENTATION=-
MIWETSVQGAHDPCAFEVLLDVADVVISAERYVVDPVRDVHVPRLLVERPKEVRVAVGGEMHVPRHFVDPHVTSHATTLAAVDHLADAVNILVVVAEAVMPCEAGRRAVVAALHLLAGNDVTLRRQTLLVEVAVCVDLVAAHDVLRIEGEELTRHDRKGDVHVDLQFLLRFALCDEHLALPLALHEDEELREEEVRRQGDSTARDGSP